MGNGTLPFSRLLEMWSTSGLHIQSSDSHGSHIDFYKVSCAPLDIVLIG